MPPRKAPVQAAIWKAIIDKGDSEWTAIEIAESSGCKRNSVRDYIRPLLKGGMIKIERHSYIKPGIGVVPAIYTTVSKDSRTPVVHGINNARYADHNDY